MLTGLFTESEEVIIKKHLAKFTKNKAPFYWVSGCEVGGGKCLEGDVLIAAFNYLDKEALVANLKGLEDLLEDYVYEDIQVMHKGQDCEVWSVKRLKDITYY